MADPVRQVASVALLPQSKVRLQTLGGSPIQPSSFFALKRHDPRTQHRPFIPCVHRPAGQGCGRDQPLRPQALAPRGGPSGPSESVLDRRRPPCPRRTTAWAGAAVRRSARGIEVLAGAAGSDSGVGAGASGPGRSRPRRPTSPTRRCPARQRALGAQRCPLPVACPSCPTAPRAKPSSPSTSCRPGASRPGATRRRWAAAGPPR